MDFGAIVSGAGGANSGRVLSVLRFAETTDAMAFFYVIGPRSCTIEFILAGKRL